MPRGLAVRPGSSDTPGVRPGDARALGDGRVLNALTVDLEDWYHSVTSLGPADWQRLEDRLLAPSQRLLDLLDRHHVRATFFVLGVVAERHPDLVREIHRRGHEIASHGHAHRLVYELTPDDFRADLRRSLEILEGITGEPVLGFRAAYWTITERSRWAIDILAEEGLAYDSSIYPIRTYLYGIPGTPPAPHVIREAAGRRLYEVPPSTVGVLGQRLPVGGGFYMRAFPGALLAWGIARLNRQGTPAVVYIHPPEFDRDKPRLALPLRERVLHYHGLGTVEPKLELLLRRFAFAPVREVLGI
jgi:polysaccharide deacetylase family protein (PEP-CTERM system associated)